MVAGLQPTAPALNQAVNRLFQQSVSAERFNTTFEQAFQQNVLCSSPMARNSILS